MKRRNILRGLGGLAAIVALPVRSHAQVLEFEKNILDVWTVWKTAHLDATGRVIDSLQSGASHSEGQGYGMLLAAIVGDQRSFERMENWTRVNLAIRRDNLLAWRWLPDGPERVPDTNNASDGDLFRAWALLQASERFSMPSYRELAGQIASDLVRYCVVERPDSAATSLLLPAVDGFRRASGFIINPSYAMPLAMNELAAEFDLPILASAARGAVELTAKLASEGVVPDWIEVTGNMHRPASGFSFNAGYEAIRVPLFLIWSDLADHPAVRRYATAQARAPRGTAATVIDRSGDILETSAQAGYRAVAALSICVGKDLLGSELPPFVPDAPYYPATLHLFSMIAQARNAPRCFPL